VTLITPHITDEGVFSVATSPNPEHLLRRPKKPQPQQTSNTVKFVFAVSSAVVVAAGIAAFILFGHGRSAANGSPVVAQIAAAPADANFGPSLAIVHPKHPFGKLPGAQKPVIGVSPSPLPTATPAATPTPDSSNHPKNAAEIAKAKHEAALRLAALKRQQVASQSDGNANLISASPDAGSATASVVQQAPPTVQPISTQPPTIAPAAATPDAQPTPVYAPQIVVDARFVDRVSPLYPDIAREQGAQGTAIVLATVGPKGTVISVAIDQSTGNKVLDQSALSAARSSKFQPPEIDGKPATETYRIVYTFSL
jgi:periplasmic protein TonB